MSYHRFVCKFAVGNANGALSAVWRVWTARNKPDLFLGVEAVGQVKATVHCPRPERDTWARHYGFAHDSKGEVAEQVRAAGQIKKRATWSGANVGNDRTIEWRVFILDTVLRSQALIVPADVNLLPPPKSGCCLIAIVSLGPSKDCVYPRPIDADVHLLGEGKLRDDRKVWITYCYTLPGVVQFPRPEHNNPRQYISKEAFNAAPGEFRAVCVAPVSDGSLSFWDAKVVKKPKLVSH